MNAAKSELFLGGYSEEAKELSELGGLRIGSFPAVESFFKALFCFPPSVH